MEYLVRSHQYISKAVLIKRSIRINKFLTLKIISAICLTSILSAKAEVLKNENQNILNTSYLDSKDELKDYILDTGDSILIEFINAPENSGEFTIDDQGEIYLKRLKQTYVKGLTIYELTKLLEKRYEEFLISPEIYIRITGYKPIRIAIRGEVMSPGLFKLPSDVLLNNSLSINTSDNQSNTLSSGPKTNIKNNYRDTTINEGNNNIPNILSSNSIKRISDSIPTLSNAINSAGGFTSLSNLSKIEVIREVPISQGGGKKKAILDFNSFIRAADTTFDIRLFDGDSIFIPRLKREDRSIIPNSILSGIGPKFIEVTVRGRIENPGIVRIPVQGTLSDALNLTGPRLTLSGKVNLIRYKKDGSLLRKNINYSSKASPGLPKNPYLISGDLITVKNSVLGRTSGTLRAITEPFLGIYATKELIFNLTN